VPLVVVICQRPVVVSSMLAVSRESVTGSHPAVKGVLDDRDVEGSCAGMPRNIGLARRGRRRPLGQGAHFTGELHAEAVALVTQMVGQLGQAAAECCDHRRWHAATALARQIVEAHYLMALFRDDPDQRTRWLRASTNRI